MFGTPCRTIEHPACYSSSRSSSPSGVRPKSLSGENSCLSCLIASTSRAASRQKNVRYFVCPPNCFLKKSEALEGRTSASLASVRTPIGSRFRQPPSAYWWCSVSAAMIFTFASPFTVERFGPVAE